MKSKHYATIPSAGIRKAVLCLALCAPVLPQTWAQTAQPFLPLPPTSVSTVPSNGDVNPYGVAYVPRNVPAGGRLQPGDILVSNFNNSQNLQGTGTSITRVAADGTTSMFFQGTAPLGLTAALGVLANGIVLVGNLPTTDGTSNTVSAGSVLVIERSGKLLGTLGGSGLINGPWGMAISDNGEGKAHIFVSNVINGTVTRLDVLYDGAGEVLNVVNGFTIAANYAHRFDPAALVLGPSGLLYDARQDLLYIASSADNAIYVLSEAGRLTDPDGVSSTVYSDPEHLHGPLDLAFAPNGDLLVANSDGSNVDPNQPSEIVEFTTSGKFVSQYSVDPNNGGAFGLAVAKAGNGAVRFAAVDDNANTLTIRTVPIP